MVRPRVIYMKMCHNTPYSLHEYISSPPPPNWGNYGRSGGWGYVRMRIPHRCPLMLIEWIHFECL